MLIDPLISLAFSVHSNKGAYALLVGSGVSRAARILTGWDIVLDLIRKVANVSGEDAGEAPDKWYKERFGKEPDYSDLLMQLGLTEADRSGILRSYFEPSEEEREHGFKAPTQAHNGIAELVALGYVRVIVTTNFDRLIETAIEEAGVTPTIVSTASAAKGILPLQRNACTVFKVHGDYLDPRIKNTPAELGKYEPSINRLLDRIFDEYGLVVCGWSGAWDAALRSALERCKTHRFGTYWAARDEPGDEARKLIELRRASVVQIKDAETFFSELEEKVRSLEDLERPTHPLSAKVAVATLKRYLPEERHRIRLHDLVHDETERLRASLIAVTTLDKPPESAAYRSRLERYNALCEPMVGLFAPGCYWGSSSHVGEWVNVIERICNLGLSLDRSYTAWSSLARYPAYLMLYAGGIAALTGDQYETLAAVLSRPKIRRAHSDTVEPALMWLNWRGVFETSPRLFYWLPELKGYSLPESRYMESTLRDPLREILPDDHKYLMIFDRFEYYQSMLYVDLVRDTLPPVGRFAVRNLEEDQKYVGDVVRGEIEKQGTSWPLLRVGLFEGSQDRAIQLVDAVNAHVKRI
jgi:hypothetical protein